MVWQRIWRCFFHIGCIPRVKPAIRIYWFGGRVLYPGGSGKKADLLSDLFANIYVHPGCFPDPKIVHDGRSRFHVRGQPDLLRDNGILFF